MNSAAVLETVELSDLTEAGFSDEEAHSIISRLAK
jgi:hypothetical protein